MRPNKIAIYQKKLDMTVRLVMWIVSETGVAYNTALSNFMLTQTYRDIMYRNKPLVAFYPEERVANMYRAEKEGNLGWYRSLKCDK